jgi:hypothetical protein
MKRRGGRLQELRVPNRVRDCVGDFGVPQATEWQRIGD